MNKLRKKKGFTLIELIVVIAILGVLVLLASPRFLGYTEKAEIAKLNNNAKVLETASQMYHMDNDDWPRLTDDPYTADEVKGFSEKIYHLNGEEVELDPDGNYYDIDFEKIKDNVNIPGDTANYILQNPAGEVYSLYKPTKAAMDRIPGEPDSGGEIVKDGVYTKEEIANLVKDGYVKVETAEDLNNIVRKGLAGKYIQTKDIDLSSYSSNTGWNPIGNASTAFSGTYDGGGFEVVKLTINRPSEDYQGLFGKTSKSTIKNVGVKDVTVSGKFHVGGLVGYNQNGSTIINSYATGSVTGGYYVGGLVGYNYGSTITNSYATGAVKGSGDFVGGLSGVNGNSTISGSYSTGAVTSKGIETGGLVGNNTKGTTPNSYYDKNTSGRIDSGKGVGKPTAEMKQKSTYSGWEFDTIWQIEEGVSYPTLKWEK